MSPRSLHKSFLLTGWVRVAGRRSAWRLFSLELRSSGLFSDVIGRRFSSREMDFSSSVDDVIKWRSSIDDDDAAAAMPDFFLPLDDVTRWRFSFEDSGVTDWQLLTMIFGEIGGGLGSLGRDDVTATASGGASMPTTSLSTSPSFLSARLVKDPTSGAAGCKRWQTIIRVKPFCHLYNHLSSPNYGKIDKKYL